MNLHRAFLMASKSLRAAGLPVGLPQALSGRRPAAQQLLPFDCFACDNPVPPKEPPPAFQSERTPPPKPSLTAVSEPDPIYPICTLRNFNHGTLEQRPCHQALNPPNFRLNTFKPLKMGVLSKNIVQSYIGGRRNMH